MEERVALTRESDTLHASCTALLPMSLQLLCLQPPTLARRRRQRRQRRTGSTSRTTRRGMSEWSRNSQLPAAHAALAAAPAPAIGICDTGTSCPTKRPLLVAGGGGSRHCRQILPRPCPDNTKSRRRADEMNEIALQPCRGESCLWIRIPVHLTPLFAGMLRRS